MKPNKDFSLALVDADIVGYRCSVSSQDDPVEVCYQRIDDLMNYCLDETVGFAVEGNYKVFLTGSDNFRYEIAKSFPYKGNRSDKEKPQHLRYAREYLQQEWGAIVAEGCEADDLIATEAVAHGDGAVMVSQDKDFNTVPGWKFNFVNGNWRYDDEWSALQYFYTQVLTGDAADNIKGLYRVGPVKAGKLLEHCETEQNLWEVCLKAYATDAFNSCKGQLGFLTVEDFMKENSEVVIERVVENARLLYLRRREGELWVPPE